MSDGRKVTFDCCAFSTDINNLCTSFDVSFFAICFAHLHNISYILCVIAKTVTSMAAYWRAKTEVLEKRNLH